MRTLTPSLPKQICSVSVLADISLLAVHGENADECNTSEICSVVPRS